MDGQTPMVPLNGPAYTYTVRDRGDVVNGTAMLTVARGGQIAQGEVLLIPKEDAVKIARAIVDYATKISAKPTT